jgi:WD40 repeat protein
MNFESTTPLPTSQDVVAGGADRATGKKYDAFISYSHAMDGKVAGAVQAGLHRLARPWRALRALRTFRDTTTLSANPALWGSITAALDESRFFILLAGPEAASSSWVSREVEYWIARNGFDRMLVVVTGGELVWDAGAGQVDKARTTSLPPPLADALTSEPRFVDLRWARSEEKMSLRDPRFRDAIADLAAPLHGVSKDELIGEDVRQHTRTQRIRTAAVALLVLLLITAVIAAVVAIGQRDRAQAQAALATSRYLAAQSLAESGPHPSLGLLLAAYGLKLTDTTEARGAMLSSLWQRPHLLKVLEDHADPAWAISTLAYSPDGRRLAVASRDGTVVLWDVATGRPIGRPLGGAHNPGALFQQWIYSLAYQPQGRQIASGNGSGEITIWDLATGRKATSPDYGAPVRSLAYSPDGKLLAAGFGDRAGTVALYSLSPSKPPRVFRLGYQVHSVAFSRNGKIFAAGDEAGDIELWDLADPQAAPRHLSADGDAQDLAFSPGDKLLACACGGAGIRLWPVQGTETAGKTLGLGPELYGVEFSRDGKMLASSGDDGYVRLWNLATLRQESPPLLASWKDSVYSVAFSPVTGTLASGSGDGQLLLWSERAGRPLGTSIFARGPEATVAAVSENGHLLAVTTSRGAALWDDQTGREIGPLPSLPGHATSAAFNAAGTSVLVGYDKGEVAVYDVKTRRLIVQGRPMSSGQSVQSVAFSADDTVLVAADGAAPGHVDLWDARTGASIGRPINTGWAIDDIATDPQLNIAATANFDGTVRLWDVRTGKPQRSVTGHNDSVMSVSFSRDGRFLASAGLEGTVIVTDVKTGRTVSTFPITPGVDKVALDATGKTLAVATDTTVQLWDVATAREIGPPFPLGARVSALSFTDDGDLVSALATNLPEIIRWNFDARTWIQTACAIANRDLTVQERNQIIGSGSSGVAACGAA